MLTDLYLFLGGIQMQYIKIYCLPVPLLVRQPIGIG